MTADLFYTRSLREIEAKRRTKVAIWAYAYEFEDNPLVSDAIFDSECAKINPAVATTRPELDEWFKQQFSPHTGSWVHVHPDLERLRSLYNEYYVRS